MYTDISQLDHKYYSPTDDSELSSAINSSKDEIEDGNQGEVFSQPAAERATALQHCHRLPLHSEI